MRMSILKLFFYRNMDVTINNFKKKIVRIYLKNNFFYGTKFGIILNKHLGK